jgi:tetratricopeptide (TPR) repeat protein
MAESGKGIGKLGLAILESLLKSKFGEEFSKEQHAPTDEQISITEAMQNTADRFWKDWTDKRTWDALFNHLPKKRKLLTNLGPAVKNFYWQPTDSAFPRVLTKILQGYNTLAPEAIQKVVAEYITTLTEELITADKQFRENAQGLTDPRPAGGLRPIDDVPPSQPSQKDYDIITPRKKAKRKKTKDKVLPSQPPPASQKDKDIVMPHPEDEDELLASQPLPPSQEDEDIVTPHQVDENESQDSPAKPMKLPEDGIPEPNGLPKGSRFPNNRPNPHFMGREEDLKRLEMLLKGKSTVAIGQVTTATGTGGVGKTQLASEFVQRYGDSFTGGVFWLSFTQPDLIPFEVAACGNIPDDTPLETQVKQVLSDWRSGMSRLLIFDNCEDPQVLAQWLPTTGGSRVLITSQQRKWDPALAVEPMLLGLLKRPESIALLRSFREDLVADDPDLEAIAGELGDLPLALHLAGNFLQTYRDDISLLQYLDALRQPIPLKGGSLKRSEFSPSGLDLKVGRVLAIDIEWLGKERGTNRLALDLLQQIACFAPGELIPRELLRASAGAKKVGSAVFGYGVNRLLEMGLVEQNNAGDLRMHRLVAGFVRDMLPDKSALAQVEQGVLSLAVKVNQSGHPARMRPVLAHLKHLADQALKKKDSQATRLANELGYYLEVRKDYPGARSYYMQALTVNQKVLGDAHPDTTISLNNLGGLLESTGNYTEARPYYEKALVIRRKVLGAEHPDTARSLNNMGHLLQMMGNFSESRPYYEQALAVRRKVLGEEHPDTVTSLSNLGGLLRAMGDFAGARTYFRQALVINRKVRGEEHLDTASSLNNLGEVLQELGDFAGARPYFEQALATRRKLLGEEHPDTATSFNNLGEVLCAMDDYAGAQPHFEQALAIRRKVLGEEHPATITSLTNLGELLQAKGDYAGARLYFEQALAINRKVKGEMLPGDGTSFNIQEYSLRTKIALAILFVFSIAVIGWQAFSRQGVSSSGLNEIIPTSTEIAVPSSAIIPGPVFTPTKTIYRRKTPTPTNTRTATFTATKTVTRSLITPTSTPRPGGNVGPGRPTNTRVQPTKTPVPPTKTPVPPTKTPVPPTAVPTTPKPPTPAPITPGPL